MDATALLSRMAGPELEDLDDDADIVECVEAYVGSDEFNVDLAEWIAANTESFRGVVAVEEHRLEAGAG